MIRYFTEADIRDKVSMKRAIELMKEAFFQLSTHSASIPVRTVISSSDNSGCALYMPSYSPVFQLFGLKMVSVFEKNEEHGLPAIQGNMLIMDGNNGRPLALMEAEFLTALRTGAASGLATDLLSRKESRVLVIFGTGRQAETQLEGVLNVRAVEKVFIYGTSKEKAISFADRMKVKFSINILPARSLENIREADIICTATSSSTPVFQSHLLKAGVHINAIGSYKPTMQEIPSDVIVKSLLVVDQFKAAMTEAGDIIIPIEGRLIDKNHIHAELGEIISGKKIGRTHDNQVTIFKSVGNAIQDLAIAWAVLSDQKKELSMAL